MITLTPTAFKAVDLPPTSSTATATVGLRCTRIIARSQCLIWFPVPGVRSQCISGYQTLQERWEYSWLWSRISHLNGTRFLHALFFLFSGTFTRMSQWPGALEISWMEVAFLSSETQSGIVSCMFAEACAVARLFRRVGGSG